MEKKPFDMWMQLLDPSDRLRLYARLDRLELGNLGDWRRISSDLFELRFTFGAGFRVYFCMKGNEIVILCAGNKRSQKKDIQKAIQYFNDINMRLLHEGC